MTLGQKITELRAEKNLSQEKLAEQIGVSRQSVSKWETDASVPELSKLIQLSELFQVSLDELVKDRPVQETKEPEPVPQSLPSVRSVSTQRVIGFILLGVGLLCLALGLGLGIGFGTILFTIGNYLVGCSLICLLMKDHAGLVIGWISWALILVLAPYFTGIDLRFVFHLDFYRHGFSIQHLLIGLLWGVFALLLWRTARLFHSRNLK